MHKIKFLLLLSCLLVSKSDYCQQNCDTAYFNKGYDYMQRRNLDSAIIIFSKTIDNCPDFTVAYLNRGICYYYKNQMDSAKLEFNKTIEVAKAKFKMTMTIANTLFQFEKYYDAYDYFEKATKFRPQAAEPYFKMGRCLWLGHIPIVLEKYNGDYRTDLDYKNHLKADILKLFDKATSLDSTDNYEYFYYKGFFYSNFDDNKMALLNFERSIEIHPVIKAFEYCALICKDLKLNDKACKYINQWAMMFSPGEEMNPFQKKEYAKNFCKELGVTK